MRFINKYPEGYVPISMVVAFKKIKALVSNNAQLASILRNSGKLVETFLLRQFLFFKRTNTSRQRF
ncbi:putative la-type HTH domain, winged helix-like DNA-binding domain superfamily [Helianthus anomalus]